MSITHTKNVALVLLVLTAACRKPAEQHATRSGDTADKAVEAADMILTNGVVYTMEDSAPTAQAVAIRGDKIVFVGDAKGVESYRGDDTEVIDLDGKTVLPGFVSAHDHIVASRWMSLGADLNPAKNPKDIERILKEYMAEHPDEKLIRGMGWNVESAGGKLPTAKQLDAIVKDKPAILIDYTGHEAWLNSKALELGGVTKDSPDLKPGTTYWVRDKSGTPTGVAIEGQWMPTFVKLGFWEPETMVKESADELFAIAAKNGTTTVLVPGFVTPNVVAAQESMDDYKTIMALLEDMDQAGKLPLRLFTLPWFKSPKLDPEEVAAFAAQMRDKYSGDKLRTAGVKIHPETNWNSWGAPMIEPYSNKDTKGQFGVSPERMEAMTLAANERGLDVFTHADGSATARAAIDAIEASRKAGNDDSRNGIHHLIWLHPDDFARIRDMKIPVNITPAFSNDWSDQDKTMLEYMGKERIESMVSRYPELASAGNKVSISADVPSTSPSMQAPLYVIESAVTFQDPQDPDSKPFPPNRKPMTLEQALRAMTIDAAWQLRMEDKVGSLKTGKYADVVVLDRDPHDAKPRDIADIKVLGTMLGGEFTHREGL